MQLENIRWEYEDQLPKGITDEEYDRMFPLSQVDGVRVFPYIELDGDKKFLGVIEC